jgi:hypothetical protein
MKKKSLVAMGPEIHTGETQIGSAHPTNNGSNENIPAIDDADIVIFKDPKDMPKVDGKPVLGHQHRDGYKNSISSS